MSKIVIDLPMFCKYRRDPAPYYCKANNMCPDDKEYPEHCPFRVIPLTDKERNLE